MPATGAPEPADRDQQRRPAPAERLVRKHASHALARRALAVEPLAPPVRLVDPAGQQLPVGLELLPEHLQAELVEPAERGPVRAGECSVQHAGVLQMEASELPSWKDLDPDPASDTTTTPTTPSSVKSPKSVRTRPGRCTG